MNTALLVLAAVAALAAVVQLFVALIQPSRDDIARLWFLLLVTVAALLGAWKL